MMELIERRDVASQKVGVRLYFSQNDLVILILVPIRRNGQPLVLMGIRVAQLNLSPRGRGDLKPFRHLNLFSSACFRRYKLRGAFSKNVV